VAAAEAARLTQLRNRSRFNLAALALEHGDVPAAEAAFAQLLTEAEWSGDSFLAGRVVHGLSYVRHVQGRFEAALELSQRACLLKERTGDREGAASSRSQQALLLMGLGRMEEARELAASAAADSRTRAERWLLANQLDSLGSVELAAGDARTAQRTMREALTLAQATGDRRLETQVRLDLALAHLAVSEVDAALEIAGPRPEPSLGPEVTLFRLFVEGVSALLAGRPDDALRAAAELAERARAGGYLLLERVAGGLAAAVRSPVPPADLACLPWTPSRVPTPRC
jgi:tetratricopeptide (TPR) repeat protein